MTREQIDRLMEAIMNNDEATIVQYVDDEELKNQVMEVGIGNIDNALSIKVEKNLMVQLEKEGYDVWKRFVQLDESYVIKLTSNKEYINKALEDKDFSEVGKTSLLIISSDVDKVKQYINSNELNFSRKQIVEMIINCQNGDFVRECIANSQLNLEMGEIVRIIANLNDVELAEEWLNNPGLGLLGVEMEEILCGIGNPELAEKYIKDERLGSNEILNILSAIKDISLAENAINDKEIPLDSWDKTMLLTRLKDAGLVRRCLKNKDLDIRNGLSGMIAEVGDVDLARECIKDKKISFTPGEAQHILEHIRDPQLAREVIKNKRIKLEEDQITVIVSKIADAQLAEECIKNRKINLAPGQITQILIAVGDADLSRKFIYDKKREFSIEQIADIVSNSNDAELAKEYINSDLSFSELKKNKLVLATKQRGLIEEQFGSKCNKALNLPPKMTIGMEIECEGYNSDFIKKSFEYANWEAKGDGSLRGGVEIVSPILQSTEESTKEIYTVTGLLNGLDQSVSERCGGHIHIGADYLTSVQAYENLMELWCNNEKALYAMSNEKGTQPRDGSVNRYAQPLSPKMHDAMENGTVNIENEDGLDEFVKDLKEVQGERYSGLNLKNINSGKNTIEFRIANGTLNPELWIENANLFGGIVVISEELAQIQKDGIRSEEDKHKLEIFDKLKEDISEKEKVEILLELAGVELETYMERYQANIGLIKENQEMEEAFVGKEPLDFKAAKDKFKEKEVEEVYGEVSAHAQQEAMGEIVEGHERNLQNERDDRNYAH